MLFVKINFDKYIREIFIFFVSNAQNVLTFTKYKGYDPEVGSINQDALLSGIDNGRYPSPITTTLGLTVNF
mgnify:CR=1 FL=1